MQIENFVWVIFWNSYAKWIMLILASMDSFHSSFQIIDILVPDTRGWLERYQENYMMKFE